MFRLILAHEGAKTRQKRTAGSGGGEKTLRDVGHATRHPYSAEEKIRIVLYGLRGETSIAELCRREGKTGVMRPKQI